MLLTPQEQHVLDSQSPIFCALIAEMFDDMMAADELLDEAHVDEFPYFDDNKWDEWTELSIPAPIGYTVQRLTALTTDTQVLKILDPREANQ